MAHVPNIIAVGLLHSYCSSDLDVSVCVSVHIHPHMNKMS